MVLIRAVSFTGNAALAVLDVIALVLTVPFMLFFAIAVAGAYPWPELLIVLVPTAYFAVLGFLISRTHRGWASRRQDVTRKLIWDVALLHVLGLPFAVLGSII